MNEARSALHFDLAGPRAAAGVARAQIRDVSEVDPRATDGSTVFRERRSEKRLQKLSFADNSLRPFRVY